MEHGRTSFVRDIYFLLGVVYNSHGRATKMKSSETTSMHALAMTAWKLGGSKLITTSTCKKHISDMNIHPMMIYYEI